MIGRRKGYRVTLVMPDNVTAERRQLVELFGAEVIESPGALGSNGAIALAKELVGRRAALRHALPVRQPGEPPCARGDDRPRDPGRLPGDRRIRGGFGTGGTLMGVARFFRGQSRRSGCIAAEPLPGENVQGLRSLDEGFVPEILDPTLLDGKFLVSNRDAVVALRELVAREGIFAGPSCGAVLVAAARVAASMESGTIVALLPDGGWKYLSAGTYSRDLDEMEDGPRGRGQLVVSGARPGPASVDLPDDDPGRRSWPTPGASYPNEACGIVIGSAPAADGGLALRFEPTRNAAGSPYRYEIDSADLLRLTLATDETDEVFWAIVHSHVRVAGAAVPDGHRARLLPGRPLRPRVAGGGRG